MGSRIDASICGSAIVLHLKGEGGVWTAAGIQRGLEGDVTGSGSDTLTNWPVVTGVPWSENKPFDGTVVILTALKLFDGESLGSLNPKSPMPNVYAVLKRVVTVC